MSGVFVLGYRYSWQAIALCIYALHALQVMQQQQQRTAGVHLCSMTTAANMLVVEDNHWRASMPGLHFNVSQVPSATNQVVNYAEQ